MNRCFRVLWSNARQAYVVAPEKAGIAQAGMSAGKSAVMSTGMCRTVVRPGLAAGSQAACIVLLLGASTLACPLLADTTLPVGAQITQGSASISQTNNALVVDQATQHLITHWQSFNVGADASVTFNQPDSNAVALNRVLGQDPSQILGALNANGQVFLVNPNGVVFGEGAQVNTGALVASSLGISDQQFFDGAQSGNYRFGGQDTATPPGDILNHGMLSGTVVALMAPVVRNTGTITGDTALAGGTDVTLDFNGDGLLGLTVNASALATLVDNQGIIQADGGHVILTARGASAALTGVVNHSGTIQARTLEEQGGRILLLGDMDHGTTHVNGLLDASAPDGGDGGFIETSAARVRFGEDFAVTTAASDGRTGEWLIDPYDFTIADTGGDITGAQLSAALTTNDVTIETVAGTVNCTNVSCGGAQGNGDIFVNADVTWSTNTLTLSAYRNIEINAVMTATGDAGLALEYAQGDNVTGDYYVGDVMNSSNTGRVDLTSSNVFTTQRGDDAIITYTIITSLGAAGSASGADLQGMRGNLSGNYVLGASIEAGDTATWNTGLGFTPVGNNTGNNSTRFTGTLDGLGHTITGLTINRGGSDHVGLFGYTNGAAIRNLGLLDGSITGNTFTGALVGRNLNTGIRNTYTTATVIGNGSYIGGLVGDNWNGGMINNAYASGTVTAGSGEFVGGLAGNNDASSIFNAYATGNVVSEGTRVGGLVGSNWGASIDHAYATGDVNGNNRIGGLIGISGNNSTVSNVYATGSVGGNDTIGGLVGVNNQSVIDTAFALGDVTNSGSNTGGLVGDNRNQGEITHAYYAIGTVTGGTRTGGLVGNNVDASINNAHATATVIGNGSHVGGLVGDNSNGGTIDNAYATGDVSGSSRHVGGLVGNNDTSFITNAYATGDVTGGNNDVGGLVGSNWISSIDNAYATGNVIGVSRVGGLIGSNRNDSSVTNAYATGNVSAVANGAAIGGLVGINGVFQGSPAPSISNAYATGLVTGSSNTVGGLIGNNEGGVVFASFYDADTTKRANGIGSDTNGQAVTSLTTTQALTQSSYAGFNFGSDWFMVDGSTRPFLRSEYTTTITNANQLQLMAMDLNADYTIAHDINLTPALTNLAGMWATDASDGAVIIGAGFVPIGNNSNPFTGAIDGFSHTITGLTINRPTTDYVGLFGSSGLTATINNIGLLGGSVTGREWVGGLLGSNAGSINHAFTEIAVKGAKGSTGNSRVGGLIGNNTGSITNAHSTGHVSATGFWIGGLVGDNNGGEISNSFATGHVEGKNGADMVGGLVGNNSNAGSIENSYATGLVEGDRDVGGLVGRNTGQSEISRAYANGDVRGTQNVGGLVGRNTGQSEISRAYANGDVRGTQNVGGLVGRNENSTITNAYASGPVNGNTGGVGGFVGYNNNNSTIINAYATGAVSGNSTQRGGLVGSNQNGASVSNSFWDIESSGLTVGIAASDEQGATGKTSTEMQSLATFVVAAWDIDDQGGTGKIWRIYDGRTNPLLRSFLTELTVSPTGGEKVYDGDIPDAPSEVTYSLDTVDDSLVFGSPTIENPSRNAGDYAVTTRGMHSTQSGFDLIYADDAVFSITPAQLTLTTTDVSRVYDGTLEAAGNAIVTNDTVLFGDDSLSGGDFSFLDRNAGTNKTITTGNVTIDDGNGGNNYTVSYADNTTSAITPRAVAVSGITAADRVYDGSTDATVDATNATFANSIEGDDLMVSASGMFADRNAGTDKTVTLTSTYSGDALDNYTFTHQATTTASITPAAISISTEAVTKVEDGTLDADGAATVIHGTLFVPDSLSGGSFAFTDSNPGSGKTVTVAAVNIEDGNQGGNYAITYVPNTTSTILAEETPIVPPPMRTPTPPVPAMGGQQINAANPGTHAGLLTIALAPMPAEPLGLPGDPPNSAHEALLGALSSAFPHWTVTFDRETLSITIHDPGMLFDLEASAFQPDFSTVLDDLVPRLVRLFMQHRNQIQALAIRGHASSEWRGAGSADEAHARNLALSQARAKQVHAYILSLLNGSEQHAWLAERLTSEGKAASSPVLDSQGREDAVRSRRVDFRVTIPGTD